MSRKKSEILSDFIKLMNEADRVYDAAYHAVNTEDKLTSDLLHRMELEGTTCGIRSKIATELRINRQDRRYYKDILEEYEPLREFLADERHAKAVKNLEQVLGKLRKVERYHADRTYRPRINRMEHGDEREQGDRE